LEAFEFIIIDDGSTDSSCSIVESYRDPRIRFHKNSKNSGLFTTLNLAIKESRAPLIKLWSQDDRMKRKCLEKHVAFLESHEEMSMSYCAYDLFDSDGDVFLPAPPDATPETIAPGLASQLMFYYGSIPGNIANVMIRRRSLDEIGLFREDLVVSGDFEMWVRLSEQWPIGFLKNSLIFLRSHSGQFSRQKGLFVQFMKEDREIFETLLRRLPDEIVDHARRYDLRHRQAQYVHFLFRNLLTGNWKIALQTYREIVNQSRIGVVTLLWLVTLNQRLFRLQPKYV
jgi:glycosyltransferase involved in cell wall biosynthesis